jgi:gliding motility-associated-like protein
MAVLPLSQGLYSQTSSTLGREFYFSYLPNTDINESYAMSVYLTSEVNTSGTIEVIGSDWQQEFTLIANTTLKLEIPGEFRISANEFIEKKGVYVSVLDEATAYAYNYLPGSSDGSLLLPLPSLDKEYIIHTWKADPDNIDDRTQFSVLSANDQTEIEITFAQNVIYDGVTLHDAGEVLNYTLDRGDLVYFESELDLTGTIVKIVGDGAVNCNKLAVFAGNKNFRTSYQGSSGTDHAYNQLYAVRDWGREYFVVQHETRETADPVSFLASEDNTLLEITGVPPVVLNRGESYRIFARIEHYIKADKPISVTHFTSSGGQDQNERGDLKADPFMMAVSPLKQISNDIRFNVIESPTIEQHYLISVSPSIRLNVILDGEDISDRFAPMALAGEYSFAAIPISSGVHRLQSTGGVVAHTYGFGEEEGMGYAVGGNLGNFGIDFQNIDSNLGPGQVCARSEFSLSVSSESDILSELYTHFVWDMGDGNQITGETALHSYDTPGIYTVNLYASKSPIACSDLTVSRQVEVIGAAIDDIIGPAAVCPDGGGVGYLLSGSEPDYNYQWFIEGGVLLNTSGPEAEVEWTAGVATNRLKALSISPLGCQSDTVFLEVTFNEVLQPVLPLGESFLCGDFENIAYRVPNSTGSVYNWTAEGGTIISGQDTNEIIVSWNGPGNHRLFYTENSTTISNVCQGTSPELSIVVSEQMDIHINTTAVSCFGQNDGTASVSISGGVGPYNIAWETGSTQDAISGLAGGDYEVAITDNVGCMVTRTITIAEPSDLSGYVIANDAGCGEASGSAEAFIAGGTGNYRYRWEDSFIDQSSASDLAEGNYSLVVRDEQGCELILNYSIVVPQPMEVQFETESPCPDVAEGRMSLSVSGGTSPYSFNWDIAPGVNSSSREGLPGGTYTVTITDGAGCKLSVTGELADQAPLITIPNSFSPNGDGMNDEFRAVYNCAVNFQMLVFNQWGNIIFHARDIATGWDGTYRGEPVPSGNYTYSIIYGTTLNGKSYQETVNGRVRVIN